MLLVSRRAALLGGSGTPGGQCASEGTTGFYGNSVAPWPHPRAQAWNRCLGSGCGAQRFAARWVGQPDILATAPHRESVPGARGSMAASARGTGE